MSEMISLGTARVYRNDDGELVVDTDSLRRGDFAGDDFGFEDDDDEFGDDEDDEFGDDEEFGALGDRLRSRRSRRKSRRSSRKRDRQGRRSGHRGERQPAAPKPKQRWGMTVVGGSDSVGEGGGPVSVEIRLQHDFKASDITFDGSHESAKVQSIFFGDHVVWSQPAGVPASVFGSNSQLRGILEGQEVQGGRDITVNGVLRDAGEFTVTVTGLKPVTSPCG
ncbi:MAG: hypothetical protein H6739_34675 [Alphaproteobacteria bacterium]|nr:hypothetical protein [Alphaproteobacteria bacterium]